MEQRTCKVDGCERPTTPTNLMCGMHYQRLRTLKPCLVDGCTRGRVARGMCPAHYQKRRREGFEPIPRPVACIVDDCDVKPHAGGMCKTHYLRQRRNGHFDGRTLRPETYKVWKMRENGRNRKQRERDATVERFSKSEIFERDGWICGLCGKDIDRTLKYPHRFSASLDHVLPLIHGGLHSRANTQAAHWICNVAKNSRIDTTPP